MILPEKPPWLASEILELPVALTASVVESGLAVMVKSGATNGRTWGAGRIMGGRLTARPAGRETTRQAKSRVNAFLSTTDLNMRDNPDSARNCFGSVRTLWTSRSPNHHEYIGINPFERSSSMRNRIAWSPLSEIISR